MNVVRETGVVQEPEESHADDNLKMGVGSESHTRSGESQAQPHGTVIVEKSKPEPLMVSLRIFPIPKNMPNIINGKSIVK